MDPEKYKRQVTLLCPTCGGVKFESENTDQPDVLVKCASCGRQLTKDDLIRENTENIDEHIKEISHAVRRDVANELKRAFSDSKFIKVK